VLVVDDSAVMRLLTQQLLGDEFEVTVAADPLIAMEKMRRARPDVILLDLELPRMDGLTFLRKLMREDPIPVVVCSGRAGHGPEGALRALDEGALEIVTKPAVGMGEFLRQSRERLRDSLRAAAAAHVERRLGLRGSAATEGPRIATRAAEAPALIAIGASTGGTEAIRALFESLPAAVTPPPLVVAQHMPEPYTRMFAERLDKGSALQVKEASHGDRLLAGHALIAPGNRHLLVKRDGDGFSVALDDGPRVMRHRPSVDVLFRSVAAAAGRSALGILLTGMGHDGAEGLLALRRTGAPTIAQDESTSVVFGMPKEAIALGAAARVLPLPEIAQCLIALCAEAATRPAR
jgi:two-component system chemotaxis response regulator CheB